MELRTGFTDSHKVQIVLDRTEAIAWALNEARTGDAVLIAGMGHRCHKPDELTDELINDCDIVRQLLGERRTPVSHQRMAA